MSVNNVIIGDLCIGTPTDPEKEFAFNILARERAEQAWSFRGFTKLRSFFWDINIACQLSYITDVWGPTAETSADPRNGLSYSWIDLNMCDPSLLNFRQLPFVSLISDGTLHAACK